MSRRAVAIIFAGFCTVFVAFAIRYSFGLLLPQMAPSLGISKAEAGIVYSSYFIALTVCAPLLGLLVDRSDARIILTVFVALLGTGAYLMSFSASLLQASLFFTLAGIGHSACWVPVVTVVQRWVSEKRRGIALAIVDLGACFGILAWSYVTPIMVVSYGWRGSWVSLGLLTFLVAAINFLLVRSYPPSQSEMQGLRAAPIVRIPIKMAAMTLFRDIKFWLIGFSYLFIAFSILIPFAFITTYATEELQIPYESATGLVAVIAIAGVFGKLVLGYLSDLAGRIQVMMICGAFTAAGGIGMVYAQGFLGLVISMAVFGIGYGAIWPVYAASTRDFFPKEYAGSVIGLWTVLMGIGSIFAPLISGWIIDITGSHIGAFILVVISALLSLSLLFPITIARKRVPLRSQ